MQRDPDDFPALEKPRIRSVPLTGIPRGARPRKEPEKWQLRLASAYFYKFAVLDAADWKEHPEQYVYTFSKRINGKVRTFLTYKANEKGYALKWTHWKLFRALEKVYVPDDGAFAYRKGRNTVMCLERHLSSDTFLKTDIRAFFDSVGREKLEAAVRRVEGLPPETVKKLPALLDACFAEGRMPLGFISSPILSDVFLRDVDRQFAGREDIVYTRYADDFILSAKGEGAEEKLSAALDDLRRLLGERDLELSERKTYMRRLKMPGDAIRLLGLNIVRGEKENYLTVSDAFLRKISRELGELIQKAPAPGREELRKRFGVLLGKIAYVKSASPRSAKKLERMLSIKLKMQFILEKDFIRDLIFPGDCALWDEGPLPCDEEGFPY